MAEQRSKVTTPPFRLSFPAVFEKSQYGDGQPKYSVVMLFYPDKMNDKEKAKYKAMRKLLSEACQIKFSKPLKEMAKNPNFKRGIRDGMEKEDLDGYGAGCKFATASSKMQPGIIDRDRDPILKSEDLYPGCWCRATVTAYGYDNKSKGVAFGLQNIQKLGEGESFSGRTDAEDDFDNDEDDVWADEDGSAAPDGNDDDDFLKDDDEIPF